MLASVTSKQQGHRSGVHMAVMVVDRTPAGSWIRVQASADGLRVLGSATSRHYKNFCVLVCTWPTQPQQNNRRPAPPVLRCPPSLG